MDGNKSIVHWCDSNPRLGKDGNYYYKPRCDNSTYLCKKDGNISTSKRRITCGDCLMIAMVETEAELILLKKMKMELK